MLMGESRSGQNQKILNIVRSDNHKFFGLVDATPKLDNFEGRFAEILPPNQPSAENRELAQVLLKFQKVKTIRLTPPGRR
jgi:hypothetical protein